MIPHRNVPAWSAITRLASPILMSQPRAATSTTSSSHRRRGRDSLLLSGCLPTNARSPTQETRQHPAVKVRRASPVGETASLRKDSGPPDGPPDGPPFERVL